MKPRVLTAALALVTILSAGGVSSAAEPLSAPITYAQVRPIFAKHCLPCHSAKDADGELVMETFESLMKGGESGPALVRGKAADSLLVQLVERQKKPYMPPPKKAAKVPDADAALIRAWVDGGVPGPRPGEVALTLPAVPKIEPKAPPRRPVSVVAYEPKGKVLAIARTGDVELRSADGQTLLRTLAGHKGSVNDVAFSADGTRLATAAGEPGTAGEVRLWNVADGKPVRTFDGHRDAVYAVALSPDGRTLATGSYDQTIILWDVESGRPSRKLEGHNGTVFDLAFRPDGRVLASVSADRTLKLWGVADGRRLDTRSESGKELHAVAFTPDGGRVAAGGADNRIRVWQVGRDAAEGTNTLLVSQFAHEGAILRLAFSADGKSILSSADDRSVKLFDAADVKQRVALPQQPDWPSAVAFGADDKTLVVGRLDGTVGYYDAATGKELPAPKPEVAGVEPAGMQRGRTVKVKFTGKSLARATGAKAAGAPDGKLTAKALPDDADRGDVAWVELAAAADLVPGTYDITLTTRGGDGRPVKFHVDTIPQAAEQEPNDLPSQATALALPAGASGAFARRGDADHFAFYAMPGQTIVFDLAARRIGSKASGVLTLLDAAGKTLATSAGLDDDPDPLLAYTFQAEGPNVVRMTDLLNGASPEHYYRLSAGSFGFVTGCIPLAVPANSESGVRLVGHNLPADATINVRAGGEGEFDVPLDLDRFRNRRPLRLHASVMPDATESEPNDAPAQASSVPVPGSVSGTLRAAKDVGAAAADADVYRFEAKAGQRYVVQTLAGRRGSPADTRVEVLWPDGRPVERVQLRAVRDSYINFRAIDANGDGARFQNWEEMDLNQYMYMSGEVVKLFLAPRGPDSDYNVYKSPAGKRRTYFDTTATGHALDERTFIVEPHPPGEALSPNGLPVFRLNYANDDDAGRELGTDSRLLFTAPADGAYLVRVTDTRGFGGDRFVYRLTVRPAKPDFAVTFDVANPPVPAGSGRGFTVKLDRIDGFDGQVRVDLAGAPPGFLVSTPVIVEAGHLEAKGTIYATPGAKASPAGEGLIKAAASAAVEGKEVTRPVPDFGRPSIAPKPAILVSLTPAGADGPAATTKPSTQPAPAAAPEITVVPGKLTAAWLRVDVNGHKGPISFDVENLPHGVIVADIGLNGVLIPEGQAERKIFLQCAPWVAGTERLCHARAREAGNPTSTPVMIRVRGPGQQARQ